MRAKTWELRLRGTFLPDPEGGIHGRNIHQKVHLQAPRGPRQGQGGEMKELIGDLWDKEFSGWKGVPTNGVRRKDGSLVMGRGVATQAKARYPGIDTALGSLVGKLGNTVFFFDGVKLFSFPTKEHWNEDSNLDLIEASSKKLADFARNRSSETFFLPRVGTGEGNLPWAVVKARIESILPDNVIILEESRIVKI